MLARAAAKGLLGGIIPEQSKTGKRGKHRSRHVASAASKPSSPSDPERQTGNELENGQDPVAAAEHEEETRELGQNEKREDQVGAGGKKRKGLKGSKRKVKQQQKHTNRTTTTLKHQNKEHRKNPPKRKVNLSHHKRRLTKSKRRRIPRLTLTLISSAKASSHLSSITALAHKLRENTAVETQQTTGFSNPSPARQAPQTHHSASKHAHKQISEKSAKDSTKPENPFNPGATVVRLKTQRLAQDGSKPADFFLPPLSCPSHSSLSTRSGSPLSQRPPRGSNSQLIQKSASSSSVSLPEL